MITREFSASWWKTYVENLYEAQQEKSYESAKEKSNKKGIGVKRAIAFFKKLDEKTDVPYL